MKKTNLFLFTFIILLAFSCKNNEKTENQEEVLTAEEKAQNVTKIFDNNIKFETYCNGRFGFCIDYPLDVLFPQGESENGDGQIFKSKDAENTLWVYRDYRDNIDPKKGFGIETAFNEDSWGNSPDNPKRVITYKHLGKNYFVVSGYNDGKIFYQKTMLTKDGLATALIEYSESEKDFYDKVAEQIFKTFKWHDHKWLEV